VRFQRSAEWKKVRDDFFQGWLVARSKHDLFERRAEVHGTASRLKSYQFLTVCRLLQSVPT